MLDLFSWLATRRTKSGPNGLRRSVSCAQTAPSGDAPNTRRENSSGRTKSNGKGPFATDSERRVNTEYEIGPKDDRNPEDDEPRLVLVLHASDARTDAFETIPFRFGQFEFRFLNLETEPGKVGAVEQHLEHCPESPVVFVLLVSNQLANLFSTTTGLALSEHFRLRKDLLLGAVYSEEDELCAFRLKYRLSERCKFAAFSTAVGTPPELRGASFANSQEHHSGNDVRRLPQASVRCRTIVRTAIRLHSESIRRRYWRYATTGEQSELELAACDALFDVFPRTVYLPSETGASGVSRLLVQFAPTVLERRRTIDPDGGTTLDLLLDGESTFDSNDVRIEWKNDRSFVLLLPEAVWKRRERLSIGVIAHWRHYLGEVTVRKVTLGKFQEPPTTSGPLLTPPPDGALMSPTAGSKGATGLALGRELLAQIGSEHFLESVLAVSSLDELDSGLASEFARNPAAWSHFFQVELTNCSLPTWLHFAAHYGLERLLHHLLTLPSAGRAVRLSTAGQHRRPIDLAISAGHWSVVQALIDFERRQIDPPEVAEAIYSSPKTPGDVEMTDGNEYGHVNGPTGSHVDNVFGCDYNRRIADAKSALLRLIDDFKSGMSIGRFEAAFSQWESDFEDVLVSQLLNDAFRFSLNEIRKLCREQH